MVWDKNFPSQTDIVKDTFTKYHDNWDAIEDTFAADHIYPGLTDEGEHLQVKFTAPIATPVGGSTKNVLYIKDFAATQTPFTLLAELTFLDSEGNESQLVSGGRVRPKTIYISWNGTTATTAPAGVTVTQSGTGIYLLTFPQIGGDFLLFNYAAAAGAAALSVGSISEQTATTATLKTFQANGNAVSTGFRLEIRAAS